MIVLRCKNTKFKISEKPEMSLCRYNQTDKRYYSADQIFLLLNKWRNSAKQKENDYINKKLHIEIRKVEKNNESLLVESAIKRVIDIGQKKRKNRDSLATIIPLSLSLSNPFFRIFQRNSCSNFDIYGWQQYQKNYIYIYQKFNCLVIYWYKFKTKNNSHP